MPKDSPILVRIFKEESELEVWKQDASGRYALLKVYPICRWSGALGPKVTEGDRQAPEGFYPITPGLMNPNSDYYLAINTGFPNLYDRANNRHGSFLMIHGDCSSRGCYAMTDEEIGEIYALARDAFEGGQKEIQLQAYPFRMTPANMARHRNNPNFAFWKMIKRGNDDFVASRLEPKVDVCDRHYVFDAVTPNGSNKPLVFNPTGRCPPYELDPTIADAVKAKEQKDNLEFAELVKQNAPTAPLDTHTDGGMNRVFISKLDTATYTYDDKGHLHVPPLQPGQLPPVISPPRGSESDMRAAVAEPPVRAEDPLGSAFGGLFSSQASAEPAASTAASAPEASAPKRSATATPPKLSATATAPQRSATATVRKSKPARRDAPAAVAGLRPGTQARKVEPREAAAKPKPKAEGQQQASAFAPPASNGGLISGAQPMIPSGSFNSRWQGLQ
jgi:murein L,D-transpeptidase YafK